MSAIIGGLLGGTIATRLGFAATTAIGTPASYGGRLGKQFFTSPLIQGGQFGVGYTGGAYGGYGATNTWDPFGLHKPKYKHYQQNIRMPYGNYGRFKWSRFRRYRGYRSRYFYRRRYY